MLPWGDYIAARFMTASRGDLLDKLQKMFRILNTLKYTNIGRRFKNARISL